MGDAIRDTAPRIYTGLDEQHRISWIQEGWAEQSSKEFPEWLHNLRVDDRVTKIMTEAIARGEKNITIFDIGSGSEGYFVSGFLKQEDFPQIHNVLEHHLGITLHIVGVTGAKAGTEQGMLLRREEREYGSDAIQKSKIIAENYSYTITKSQTLKKFLDLAGIDRVHASFSTFGVGYFTPANFEQCITDIADALAPGGEFFGITWDAVPAGARRMPGGIFFIREDLPESHPLHMVFDNLSSNERFVRFYAQPPADQIRTYLSVLEYGVKKGLISLEQAKHLLIDKDVFPMAAFVRGFHTYTTTTQHQEVLRHLAGLAQKHPWVSKIHWEGNGDFFDEVSKAPYGHYEVDLESSSKSVSKQGDLQENRQETYDEVQATEREIWSYIEKRFAAPMRKRIAHEKEELNRRIAHTDWSGVKEAIQKLDPTSVAGFWDWNGTMWKYQNIVIDNQAKRTTEAKQASLDRLKQRDDLIVYSSRIPDGQGLDVFIGKRQADTGGEGDVMLIGSSGGKS